MFGMEINLFAGRKVLLSAATRGLGPALARKLVSRGGEVVGIDDCAHSLEAMRVALGGSFTGLPSNQCDMLPVTEIARWVADEHGSLFAMICNTALPWPTATVSRLDTTRSIVQSRLLATLVVPQLSVHIGSQMIILETQNGGLKPLDLAALTDRPDDAPHILRATVASEIVRHPAHADRTAAELLSAANEGRTSVRLNQPTWARIGSQVSQRFCFPLHKAGRSVAP